MPVYEYKCKNKNCETLLEQTQNILDKPLVKCPICKKKTLERLISSTSFVLKGSGWYKK